MWRECSAAPGRLVWRKVGALGRSCVGNTPRCLLFHLIQVPVPVQYGTNHPYIPSIMYKTVFEAKNMAFFNDFSWKPKPKESSIVADSDPGSGMETVNFVSKPMVNNYYPGCWSRTFILAFSILDPGCRCQKAYDPWSRIRIRNTGRWTMFLV